MLFTKLKKVAAYLAPLCIVGIVMYMSALIYIGTHVFTDTAKKSDVIIVLGARVHVDQTYSPCLVGRVDHAVDLYRQGYAGKLIFTGSGDPEIDSVEAQAMKQIALRYDVTPSAMLLEDKATNTYENLSYSKALMAKKGLHSAIIVSEPFHLPRAALVAQKLGMDYTVSPAINSPCWYRFTFISPYFLREGLALLYYIVRLRII